jgi:hypothetical protein
MKLTPLFTQALATGAISTVVVFAAHATEPTLSGDRLMDAVLAGYTRPVLDRGGWENTLMTNSEYTAANPLLAVGVGSGATSVVAERVALSPQLAAL